MKKQTQKALALLLAVTIFCFAALPAAAEEAAKSVQSATGSNIQLMKTEGTVAITNSSGRGLSLRDNMLLYNGYRISTQAASYAWINLDSKKLTKLDAVSEAEVRKSGKALEVMLSSGSLFFNVTSPLTQEETLNIRTATMVVGIRGTSGWIRVRDRWSAEIFVLEGAVECSVTDPVTGQVKAATIQGGEKAVATAYAQDFIGDKCAILQEKFDPDDIDGFVLAELAEDEELRALIYEKSGLEVHTAAESAQARLEQAQQEMQQQLDSIGEQLAQQDSDVSTGTVWDRDDNGSDSPAADPPPAESSPAEPSPEEPPPAAEPPAPDSSGGSGSDRDDSSGSTVGPVVTLTMPVTAAQVQGYLDQSTVTQVILQPGGGNSLTIDIGMTVPGGKTLTAESGVGLTVAEGRSLTVDGTVTGGSLVNSGTVTVASANTLRVSNITNTDTGTFNNTASGRVVAEKGIQSSGVLKNAGQIDGRVTVAGGSFTMTGGSVNTASDKVAVDLENGAAFQLSGGTINSEVYLGRGCTFIMSGGTIDGGSDVAVLADDGSSFIMSGGEIVSASHSTLSVGGVTKLELNDGTITQNAAGGYAVSMSDAVIFAAAYHGTTIRAKQSEYLFELSGGPWMLPGYRSVPGDGYYYLQSGDPAPENPPGSGPDIDSDPESDSDPSSGSGSDSGSDSASDSGSDSEPQPEESNDP